MICELLINLSVLINSGFDKQVIDTSFDFVVTINYNARSQMLGSNGSNHVPAPVARVGHDLCTNYGPAISVSILGPPLNRSLDQWNVYM